MCVFLRASSRPPQSTSFFCCFFGVVSIYNVCECVASRKKENPCRKRTYSLVLDISKMAQTETFAFFCFIFSPVHAGTKNIPFTTIHDKVDAAAAAGCCCCCCWRWPKASLRRMSSRKMSPESQPRACRMCECSEEAAAALAAAAPRRYTTMRGSGAGGRVAGVEGRGG